ncbi:hypothetical protein [Pseudomonas viridiflava]|uniref:hypothetical protein n=1 Tax=Pseudomonas viridiflava TaxID=33069 RepID=UPI000C08B29A|nr:hypothetical protein [Pseudomonas viridiflava]MEE4683660.1 hypothetical protein [Pseudomonas alliivorans]PHN61907.1 hypothetical protein AO275_20470 [Pseudomonas viridiflava]
MQHQIVDYRSGEPRGGIPAIIQIMPLSMPRPPAIAGLINGQLASVWISLRLQNLQNQWMTLLNLFSTGQFQDYQFCLESVLVSMKRVIDDLVMVAYCIHKTIEIEETMRVEVDGWGVLFRKGKPTKLGEEILEKFVGEYDSFPDVLNDLVNALKHSYLMPEARNEWNNSFPLVRAIYATRNDYSQEVEVHDHDMCELVLGFNKFVKQVVVRTHPHSVGDVLPLNI